MRKVLALALADVKITARRSEALIVNLVVPIGILIVLSKTSTGVERTIPFSYFQTVLGTSLLSLGITTGFDRRFRVLVRLGTTPLGRRGLVLAKIMSLLVVQTVQLLILSSVGLALGWRPHIEWILAFPLCWMASCAFAGIALLIAGRVKAETNLGLQNLAYIALVGFGAIGFSDNESVPTTLRDISHIIPSGALHSLLRCLAGIERFSILSFASLAILAIILPLLSARKFSFDE